MRMGRTTTTTRAQHGASHGASELVGWYVAKSPQSSLGFARSNRELTTALFIGRHSCWYANYTAGFFFRFHSTTGGMGVSWAHFSCVRMWHVRMMVN